MNHSDKILISPSFMLTAPNKMTCEVCPMRVWKCLSWKHWKNVGWQEHKMLVKRISVISCLHPCNVWKYNIAYNPEKHVDSYKGWIKLNTQLNIQCPIWLFNGWQMNHADLWDKFDHLLWILSMLMMKDSLAPSSPHCSCDLYLYICVWGGTVRGIMELKSHVSMGTHIDVCVGGRGTEAYRYNGDA